MRFQSRLASEDQSGAVFYLVDPYDIISALLETLSYGIFLVLFLLSTALLVQRRNAFLRERETERVKLRSLMFYLVTGVLMFMTITAKWAFWWAEFLPIPGHGPGIVAELPRLKPTAYRLTQVCLKITVMLGDIITIYRLWVLSNGNKTMIVFPIVGLLGFLACAIALAGPASESSTRLIPIIHGKLELLPWDIAATSCTVGITVYVTVMIAWIIMKSRMYLGAKVLEHGVRRALVIMVESAAIYTIWNLLFLIAGLGFQSRIGLSLIHCMPTISGISVMLINVRVGLGWALSQDERVGAHIAANPRRHHPLSGEQRGICISTVVYTEPSSNSQCEVSCAQPGDNLELGDTRSVNSSITTRGKSFSV